MSTVMRVRGSLVGTTPIPGCSETHFNFSAFFAIGTIMAGVLGAVLMSMVSVVRCSRFRPHKIEMPMIEYAWTLGPLFVITLVGVPTLTMMMGSPTIQATPIAVVSAIGHQWYWEYQQVWGEGDDVKIFSCDSYTETESSGLGVARLLSTDAHFLWPSRVPVQLMVSSADVIHNFNIKPLSISMDAVPGRVHSQMCEVNSPGLYYGLCSEVCGPGHYSMALVVEVVPLDHYVGFFNSYGE